MVNEVGAATGQTLDPRVAELLDAARRALPYITDTALQVRLRAAINALAAPISAAPAAPASEAGSPATPPPAPAPAPPAAGDVLTWDLAADEMEIPVAHPSRFRPGQIIAIGEGPVEEHVRVRSIMGSRLLGVRGVDDTEIRDHPKGRRITIVR